MRALYSDVTAGRIVEGGSTITQELVRNLYLGDPQRTFSRKVKEACLALKLAQTWPKKRILTAYLNEVFYGRAAYGAQAGAETFFSRRARDLTLAQAALLAGLPQAPTVYDPFLHPAIATAAARRRAARDAREPRTSRRQEFATARVVAARPEAGDAVHRAAAAELLRLGEQQLVARFGARRVDAGGLPCGRRSTRAWSTQARAAVRSVLQHATDPAAAVVAIDPRTGAVQAMVSYLPDGRKLTVQPRDAEHAHGGQRVQAVRPRDGDPARRSRSTRASRARRRSSSPIPAATNRRARGTCTTTRTRTAAT